MSMDASDPQLDPASLRLLEAIGELEAVIARIDDEIAEEDAAAGGEPEPDAGTQASLTRLCTPDDAPLEWRSILGRVERGTLTWSGLWADPRSEGPAGVALVRAAITADTAQVVSRLDQLEAGFTEQLQHLEGISPPEGASSIEPDEPDDDADDFMAEEVRPTRVEEMPSWQPPPTTGHDPLAGPGGR